MIDLGNIEQRVRRQSHTVVAEALIRLIYSLNSAVEQDVDHISAIRKCLQEVLSNVPEEKNSRASNRKMSPKEVTKKKAPPPPKKTRRHLGATQAIRYALFWNPVDLSQIETPKAPTSYLAEPLLRGVEVFKLTVRDVQDMLKLSGKTVFEARLCEAHEDTVREMVDLVAIDKWFRRPIRKGTVDHNIDSQEKQLKRARPSLLGAVMSQRIGIMIHSLRKSLGPGSKLIDVKRAMLECSLGKEEIALMVDTVPNSEDIAQSRKHSEWLEGVQNIKDHIRTASYNDLYEDENFALFIDSIPNFHRRLACMYVTSSFGTVAGAIKSRLSLLSSGIRMLMQNPSIQLLWNATLRIGNILNEGTVRADQEAFKLSALKRVMEVRGNEGMTLVEYLAAFVEPIFSPADWKLICKAKDAGVIQTYVAARNISETILTVMGENTETENELPQNLDKTDLSEGLIDQFREKMRLFGEANFQESWELMQVFLEFVQTYVAAAYFFVDSSALLPLDAGIDGCTENDECPARDLLMKICPFLTNLRQKEKCGRVARQKLDTDRTRDLIRVSIGGGPSNTPIKRTDGDQKLNQRLENGNAKDIENRCVSQMRTPICSFPSVVQTHKKNNDISVRVGSDRVADTTVVDATTAVRTGPLKSPVNNSGLREKGSVDMGDLSRRPALGRSVLRKQFMTQRMGVARQIAPPRSTYETILSRLITKSDTTEHANGEIETVTEPNPKTTGGATVSNFTVHTTNATTDANSVTANSSSSTSGLLMPTTLRAYRPFNAGRRRHRSSIEATFNFARHLE